MKTICVPCQREYRCEKNGVTVEETMNGGEPYRLWQTDKWKCPGCSHEIIAATPPNQRALAEHFEDCYDAMRIRYAPEVILR